MRNLPALLLASALCLSTALSAAEIRLASEPVCPYICVDEKSGELQSPPGVVIEIVRDALSLHGHLLKYAMRPLTRGIREVQAGALDAVLTWAENVPGLILPTEPVVIVDTCFFARHGSPWQYQGLESLNEVRLGMILGDHLPGMEAYLQQHRDDDRVQWVAGANAMQLNIRKLLAGRIDLFFDERYLVAHQLHAQGIEDQVMVAGCPFRQPVFLAFAPGHASSQRWAEQLSDGIRKLKASGRIRQILAHYGLAPTATGSSEPLKYPLGAGRQDPE